LAWTDAQQDQVFALLRDLDIACVELIPFRVPGFSSNDLVLLRQFQKTLALYGLAVSSLQSLLFGTQDLHLFLHADARAKLLLHLKKCVDLAAELGAKNLVFGMPKNRLVPQGMSHAEAQNIAKDFFLDLGDYASQFPVKIGIEANAPQYGGNFWTQTREVLHFTQDLSLASVGINLDLSTILLNQEPIAEIVQETASYVSHVHLSFPYLKPLVIDDAVLDFLRALQVLQPNIALSVEMQNDDISILAQTLIQIKKLL
jgi:sugar phosphate isomerase/epimerase